MRIILLSGGSGKRLWPLSNETRSKQFLKLLKDDNGDYESMIQRIYRQLNQAIPNVSITIATGENQKDVIKNQLGEKVDLVTEPMRRDTFPAIMLSSAYLAYEKKVDLQESVIVMPVDPYVEQEYFSVLKNIDAIVQSGRADMVLMGIKPTYPSEKYGYILSSEDEADNRKNSSTEDEAANRKILSSKNDAANRKSGIENEYVVTGFCEKPSLKKAESLLKQGAFWNGGVFAFRLGYAIGILGRYMECESYDDVRSRYEQLKKTSFDYEVVEKAENIRMSLYSGYWKDLGTWNTLTEQMEESIVGEALMGEETNDTHIINELDIPVVVLGGKNLVVAASPDGILVSDKDKSSYMKPYVEQIDKRPMFEERGWGDYKVLDYKRYKDKVCSLTKYIYIRRGEFISYQCHKMREEIWIVVDGEGSLVIDGACRKMGRSDMVRICPGQKHAILALENLQLIEVQIGTELTESDIERFEWEWRL